MSDSTAGVPKSVWQLSDRNLLILLLTVFGILLTLTVVPGVFIIDEDNYLVTVVGLRHGQLTVPGTERLTPSRELVYFDPEASRRVVTSTPVVSLAPPLYAFLALPFSYASWRGLVFLNIIAFLLSIYLVFVYTRQLSQHRLTPLLSAALFGLGGTCVEYAQGVWPQMLSVALCMGTLMLSLRARRTNSLAAAAAAGALIGIAVGVREQNILFAGCIGAGLVLFSEHRIRHSAAFTLGLTLVLVSIATLNYERTGFWHPFPKVFGYASVVASNAGHNSFLEPLRVFWSKVVDYSSYGPDTDHIRSGFYQWDADSRTILMNGIVRKSWIQSSPWIGIGLVALVGSWTRQRTRTIAEEIRILSLVVLPMLAMFTAAGFNRTDGLSFNQRYFLELLPLAAIAVGLWLDGMETRLFPIATGTAIGMGLVAVVLLLPDTTARYDGQKYVPLFLAFAALLALAWRNKSNVLSVILGTCLGWGFFIHVESDLVGSRFRRQVNAERFEVLEQLVPDHSALFTYWGNKDAAGPIQLTKDVVILDTWADNGRDARLLEGELEANNRRIFVLKNDMPDQHLKQISQGKRLRDYSMGGTHIVEILGSER